MKLKTFAQRVLLSLTLVGPALSGCTAQAQIAQTETARAADGQLVTLLKTPNDGIQPQAKMDDKGTLHLIYFTGTAKAGDIFYVRSTDGGQNFSPPLRVNSQPNSAIATGTIRGAQLAIGKDHRVHVAWNGSEVAQPQGPEGTPMLYTRLNDAATAFEPQRNLITWAGGLDGGGTLAADDKGDVYVAWHAAPAGKDETERAVYLARSTDDGRTFERERKINVQPTGACGCCQMRAFVDGKGALYVLYRAAGNSVNRDSMLLVSTDKGTKFQSALLDKWYLNACPMSSYSMTQSPKAILAAWETKEQVYMSAIPTATTQKLALIAAPGAAKARKHPVVLANRDGKVLFAWTEGTGWNQGGSLAWQVYDADGRPTDQKGRAEGVPAWGLLSAIARPDGGFTILY